MKSEVLLHHCDKCIYRSNSVCPYKDMEKNMLKTEDAARLLGKAPQTIYNWSCMGKIPHTKSGGNLLFRECQLMCMIAMGSK